jgi:adenine-specific DNA-methyltransferase
LFVLFYKSIKCSYTYSILQKWNALEILDCTKFPVFKSAVVRNTINTWQKNKDGSSHVGYRNTVGVTAFDALVKKDKQIMSASDLQEMNQNWGLAFMLEPIVIRIVNKIAGQSESVINLYDVSQGYIPYRKSDLVKSYGKTEGEKIVKQRLWHSANKESEEYIQELYGRDISKYSYKSTGEYVKYGRHLACYVDIRFFNQDRIVVREITNPTIIACRLKEIYVHDPQLIAVIPKDDSSLNILWAVLNSKLATFYHFNHSPKATKGAFPKILVSDVKTFPLPNIDEETRVVIDEKVSRILSAKQSDPSADTTVLENEIDFMVYKLYGLTYDEVLVVDPETPITREQYEAKKL